MNLKRIDHIVFTVRDIDRTPDFCRRVLGMEIVTFGGGRRALGFGECRINLHAYRRWQDSES